jgi:hypothetical protein
MHEFALLLRPLILVLANKNIEKVKCMNYSNSHGCFATFRSSMSHLNTTNRRSSEPPDLASKVSWMRHFNSHVRFVALLYLESGLPNEKH